MLYCDLVENSYIYYCELLQISMNVTLSRARMERTVQTWLMTLIVHVLVGGPERSVICIKVSGCLSLEYKSITQCHSKVRIASSTKTIDYT